MANQVFTDATATVPGTLITSAWLTDVNTGTYDRLTAVTGTNAITAVGPAGMASYLAGQNFYFTPGVTNSGPVTININGLGVQNIVKGNSLPLIGLDLVAGAVHEISYDGTSFFLMNPGTYSGTAIPISNGGTGANSVLTARNNLGIGSVYSFRNKLINPNGLVNQRAYSSGTATGGANQYTLDRWRVVSSGQALSYSVSGVTTAMTAPAGGLEQVIEGSNIEGGVYTLSWIGTATATVDGTAVTNGGQTVSKVAGSNVTVRFSAGTVSLPQFELGTVVTTFEQRPFHYELQLCLRYCFRVTYSAVSIPICAGVFFSTTGAQFGSSPFPLPMRAAPAMSASSTTFEALTTAAISLGPGSLLAGNAYGWYATFSSTATSTAGAAALMRSSAIGQWVQADAEL